MNLIQLTFADNETVVVNFDQVRLIKFDPTRDEMTIEFDGEEFVTVSINYDYFKKFIDDLGTSINNKIPEILV